MPTGGVAVNKTLEFVICQICIVLRYRSDINLRSEKVVGFSLWIGDLPPVVSVSVSFSFFFFF